MEHSYTHKTCCGDVKCTFQTESNMRLSNSMFRDGIIVPVVTGGVAVAVVYIWKMPHGFISPAFIKTGDLLNSFFSNFPESVRVYSPQVDPYDPCWMTPRRFLQESDGILW